jgi:hypothetical protein
VSRDIKNNFQWVADPGGADHGMATFFPDSFREVTVRMESFREAHRLHQLIESALDEAVREARRTMAKQIQDLV